jgi:hypothetical protein
MGPVKIKSNGSYIRRCLTKIDEYKFIFIGFGTNEYNLNTFIGFGINKFKITNQ